MIEGAGDSVLIVDRLSTEIRMGRSSFKAVNDVSLDLHRGECVCIVGESGSGKSMLALSIMGVLPTAASIVEGSVHVGGKEMTALSREHQRRLRGAVIAMVPQDPIPALDPLYTIGNQMIESVRAHKALSRGAAFDQAIALMRRVRLANPQRVAQMLPGELSGGMVQRVLIAMALAGDPRVLIADEPTTALDVTVQAEVLALLAEIRRDQGLAVLMITHDMGVAATVATRLVVMYAGRVVEFADVDEMLRRPRHPYSQALLQAARRNSDEVGSGAIPGNPPDPLSLGTGCAFAARCSFVRDACLVEPPPLRPIGQSVAACVLEDGERTWLDGRSSATGP